MSIIVVNLQDNRAAFRIFIALLRFFIWLSLVNRPLIVASRTVINNRSLISTVSLQSIYTMTHILREPMYNHILCQYVPSVMNCFFQTDHKII
jgi:uncharacterized membrane-anchored protein YitT (DUF2179 family)